jgi:hypothetical protein
VIGLSESVGVRPAVTVLGLAFMGLLGLTLVPAPLELADLASEVGRLRARAEQPGHHAGSFRELYLSTVCLNEARPRCDAGQLGVAMIVNMLQLGAAVLILAIGWWARTERGRAALPIGILASLFVWGIAVGCLSLYFRFSLGIDRLLLLVGAAVGLFVLAHRFCRKRGLEIVTAGFMFGLIALFLACLSGPLLAALGVDGAAMIAGSSVVLSLLARVGAALFAVVPIGLVIVLVFSGNDAELRRREKT